MIYKNQLTVDLLIFQATSFCNIDCKYCYLPNRHKKDKITHKTVSKTLDRIKEGQILGETINILFHDGEPTVLPIDTYEVILQEINRKISSKTNILYTMQTNGTLLNQQWCDLFNKYEFGIGLSIDGPKEIHNRNRVKRNGKGTFDDTMKGLNLLKHNNIDFTVISVIDEYALDFPDEIFYFFRDLGVSRLALNLEETVGINKSSLTKNDEINKKIYQFLNRMFELQKLEKGELIIREFNEAFNAIMNAGKSNFQEGLKRGINKQYQPFKTLAVNTNGDFSTFSPELSTQVSSKYGKFTLGNVFKDSFLDALNTNKFKILSKDIFEGRELCRKTCKYFNVCGGGLPGNKYFENGTFNSAETTFCQNLIKIPVDLVLEDLEILVNN